MDMKLSHKDVTEVGFANLDLEAVNENSWPE